MSNLGPKEHGLFKTAIQLYENREYKQGLKTCEQILKKYAEHGETIALKGLFLLFTGKREEGFEVCKSGLKLSLQSHISWHILGLMHRQDKNYEEAIKCYKSALRIDQDNFQILKDLALLQLQCRQFDGAIESRRKIIFTRPSVPFHWMSLVATLHLSGNLKQALEVLNVYLETFDKITDHNQDHLFYKASIMFEMKLYDELIVFLKSSAFKNQNTRRYNEIYAESLFFAQKYDVCEVVVRKLVYLNPDSREYLKLIFSVYTAQEKNISDLFDEILSLSLLAAIEFLSFLDDKMFESKFEVILSGLFSKGKGSPAIFELLKVHLDNSPSKRDIIWNFVLGLEDQTDVALIIFKAKFLAHTGDFVKALEVVDTGILNNPEISDLYLLKASIQKESKNSLHALDTIMSKSDLLSKDKFSASKMAKYQIRYGSIQTSQSILGEFIQKPSQGEKMNDLHDMQAVWYLIEMGDRLAADGNVLDAACFYRKIETIFEDFIDDQLDFHGYSLRRMSYVEYIKFLRFLDGQLLSSVWLKRALIGQANCILNLTESTSTSTESVNQLTSKLENTTIVKPFEDDLSAESEYLRGILKTQKYTNDSLVKIASALTSNHAEDLDSIEICLKIAMRLGALLSAQKFASKLIEAGRIVSQNVLDLIKARREGDSN